MTQRLIFGEQPNCHVVVAPILAKFRQQIAAKLKKSVWQAR